MNVLTQFAQATLDDLRTVVDCLDATKLELQDYHSAAYFGRCPKPSPEQQRVCQQVWMATHLGKSAVTAMEKFIEATERLGE